MKKAPLPVCKNHVDRDVVLQIMKDLKTELAELFRDKPYKVNGEIDEAIDNCVKKRMEKK
jgi:hypothetical protein